MLVVLSGVESIHKRLIARQIVSKMNKFVVDGYELDLTMDDPFGIKDADGNYISHEDFIHLNGDDGIEGQVKTLQKMEELEEKLFLDDGTHNHFYHHYIAIEHELGHIDVPDYTLDDNQYPFKWDYSKESIVKRYKESDLDYFVITGSISKTFIDELKEELGYSNVIAINIVRNPSTVYYLHKKDKAFLDKPDDYTERLDIDKLNASLVNAALLSEDPTVHTVKFEDMINSEKLIVNDKNVGLYLDYQALNGNLTKYEYNNMVPEKIITEKEINKFNKDYTNLNLDLDCGETLSINIFERLGYEPLSYQEIVAGKFKKL